jgi:hypothetical protein
MMHYWGSFAVMGMACALVACPLKLPGMSADAGQDAAPEAAAPAEGTTPDAAPAEAAEAINASEMTRYPDEKPVDHAPLTADGGGNMRTQAGGGGDLVMILKHGTEVEKVAEHGSYYLVVADDAKDSSKKLMGWIAESAFNGSAHPAVVATTDGGTHTTPPVEVDAGAKPGPARPLDIHKNANGSCATGYASCAALCRATCKVPGDCGPVANVKCVSNFCLGPGAQPCR